MRKKSKISQLKSFAVAFRGIGVLFHNERNFRFHTLACILVISCSYFFEVKKSEWIALLILIGLVLCMEALNTAIEYICDFISPNIHPMIRNIKDIAAAAVLLATIFAVIVGCIIFIPYLLSLING